MEGGGEETTCKGQIFPSTMWNWTQEVSLAVSAFTSGAIPWPDWGFQMGLAEQKNSGKCLRFTPELTKSVL